MKYMVLKVFRDKITKSIYNVGDIVEFSEDRYKEIGEKLGEGYIKVIEIIKPEDIKPEGSLMSNDKLEESIEDSTIDIDATNDILPANKPKDNNKSLKGK